MNHRLCYLGLPLMIPLVQAAIDDTAGAIPHQWYCKWVDNHHPTVQGVPGSCNVEGCKQKARFKQYYVYCPHCDAYSAHIDGVAQCEVHQGIPLDPSSSSPSEQTWKSSPHVACHPGQWHP
ncbi:hypothetical protein PCANC_03563 [Puccinia coronata f. sp. avenae]|uniref:Secreted protein n=1 Tax=Puccinia coronata f. sp. avenae TaxID=200324 RepID=A0A2N5VV13_9BASI|nr:hypothetical protein PCASD_23796 [Puccinia coronata f. sp. avenae]PLW53834.1 hypothetical protein PCANC_03563 [Puccinia coronata f. sp. avenae]